MPLAWLPGEVFHAPVDHADDWRGRSCVRAPPNLTPDMGKVFRESHRVLKPGGRLQIADIVQARFVGAEVVWPGQVFAGAKGERKARKLGTEGANIRICRP